MTRLSLGFTLAIAFVVVLATPLLAQKPKSTSRPTKKVAKPVGRHAHGNGNLVDWTQWRGPNGSGAASGNPPTEWHEAQDKESKSKNIRWKIRLPGEGSSTPIALNDHLFITAAIKTDREGTPPKVERPGGTERRSGRRGGRRRGGRRGGRGNHPKPTTFWKFVVVALDKKTGKQAWQTTVKEVVPHEGGHNTNTQASSSPITDGKHIYADFGSRGIHCLDMSGKVVWSKDLGYMFTRREFGEGGSPALHGNTLVVPRDHEGDSFIVALDKRTGKELWRKSRDEATSWATPVVATVGNKTQAIMPGTKRSIAYDLTSGKEVWSLAGMTTNCIPSPILRGDTVYLMSGFRGAALQAVKLPGAKGDLAEGDNVLWEHARSTSYVPSALLYDDYMYFVRGNNGVLTCLDVKSGEVVYEGKRLAGLRSIYSSPVGAGGRIYLTSRDGVTKVIAHGAEFKELATNEVDETVDASPIVVGDVLYLRGKHHLYCIAEGS